VDVYLLHLPTCVVLICARALTPVLNPPLLQKKEFIDLQLQVGGDSDFGKEKRCISMHRIVAALISNKLQSMVDKEMSSRSASGRCVCVEALKCIRRNSVCS